MTSPLIKKIGGILASALPAAGITEAATLIRSTAGARTPGSVIDGPALTTTSYTCKGFVSTEKLDSIDGTLVEKDDRVVCLLGKTLAVTPRSSDRITIDGKTQNVEAVQGTAAIWTLLLRG